MLTALVDACCLVGPLPRGLLLALTGTGCVRLACSPRILDETGRALARLPEVARPLGVPAVLAELAAGLEVVPDGPAAPPCTLPDAADLHVVAAALRAGAGLIITENRRDFPRRSLRPLGLGTATADEFLAGRIAVEAGLAARLAASLARWNTASLPADLKAARLARTARLLHPRHRDPVVEPDSLESS